MDIQNQANATYVVDGTTTEVSVVSNSSVVELQPGEGLSISKTANKANFVAGEIIDYTVQITNNSGHYLNGVRIIDNLGGGNLAYVLGSASLTIGSLTYTVNPISTNPLTFTLQQLASGETMTLKYKAQVIFNLPSGVQSITNNVKGIGYTATGTIVGYALNTIQKKIVDDFSITKSSSDLCVYPNQVFRYFVKLNNNGTQYVVVTEIKDQLPQNFEVLAVYLKFGTSAPIMLEDADYLLTSQNLLTVISVSGSPINMPAGARVELIVVGYFQ